MDLPLLADREHLVEALGLADAEHPLLGLADHDLERLHVRLAQRHLGRRRGRGRRSPLDAISADDEVSPAAPRSCSETSRPRSSSSSEHSSAFLPANGSPTCTVGRLSSSMPSSALARTEAPPMPSLPGRGPEEHDDVPDARGGAADHAVLVGEPERHRVDEAVLLVRALVVDLAADRRHADRVAVVRDPGHGVVEQVARARAGGLAEAQRVEHRDRAGADREDVAQDAADAGGGALERLDRARVVVRLDLERDGQAVAHVDGARVLPRAHDDVLALRRQRPEQLLGVLVGAVLAPQQGEHRELDLVGLAAELLDDERVLRLGQAERRARSAGPGAVLRRGHARRSRTASGRRRSRAARRSRARDAA